MFLLELPGGYLGCFMSEWLQTCDLGKLDASLCSTTHRPSYLDLLKEQRFVSLGDPSKTIEDGQLLWLFKRHLKLQTLCISDPDLNLSETCCQVFQKLDYLDIYYRNRLRIVGTACADNLKYLILRGCELTFTHAMTMALQCRQLHTLEIAEQTKYMDRKKLKQTGDNNCLNAELMRCRGSLKTFVCNWTSMPLRALHIMITHCINITRLELNVTSMNDDLIYAIVSSLPNLVTIKLLKGQCPTTDGIVALAGLRQLECLDLNGTAGVTNDSLIPIILSNSGLKTICLRFGNQLTSLAVMKIAANCPGLTSLDIAHCPFMKDDALLLVANKCSELQDLQICGCDFITDTSMMRLANMCKKLTSINIKDCANITKFTVDAFAFSGVKPYKKKLL